MKTTKQTSSKQTCLGSSELPILLPSEFTGEGESAPRGYLGNYRDATKQDLNPDPLISSPQVSVTRGHWQPSYLLCVFQSQTQQQALHVLSTGKVGGDPLLTQGVGLTKGHRASVNTIVEILLLGYLCRVNVAEGMKDSLHTGAYVAVSLIELTRPSRDPGYSSHLGSCFYLWDP
ncbi:RIKEN cDNA 4631405J19 [Mus musculus]|uniref:Uncharacterized protein n=1 Tax=Mus musculus TaxID=10090 RepID=Q8CEE4_MOUSE|nr:RIKEN cDNA 4631405J19 [Mus musculus]BAC25953.1 unnamed protein product [Mus musculus]